jgi:hypothetical protein
MHAARLASSPRLRRVLAVLSAGRPKTTRQIVREARVMAVSACIAELRANGAEIACEVVVNRLGQRRYRYTMTRAPIAPAPLPETPDPHCSPGEASRRGALPVAPAATNPSPDPSTGPS